MNAFESGVRKVIPAVLIYAKWNGNLLMIHRTPSGDPNKNYHSGKWNGLGGKCELDESSLEAACREFEEESGLSIAPDRFKSLGVLQFPNFKPLKHEDWMVFVFVVDLQSADLSLELKEMRDQGLRVSDEGVLHWVPAKDVLSLNLWPGDRNFIPFVLDRQPFLGSISYKTEPHPTQSELNQFNVSKVWIQTL